MIMGVLPVGHANANSEIPARADQGRHLISEWTADL